MEDEGTESLEKEGGREEVVGRVGLDGTRSRRVLTPTPYSWYWVGGRFSGLRIKIHQTGGREERWGDSHQPFTFFPSTSLISLKGLAAVEEKFKASNEVWG